MDPIRLLLLSVALFGTGGLLSLIFRRSGWLARYASGIVGMAAAAAACMAAIRVFTTGMARLETAGLLVFGDFALHLDGFAAFMIGMIGILAFAASLYSISYSEEYGDRAGTLGFFNNLFIAAMLLVVSVANAFYFLIFWEFMTLASYFLVIFEQEKKESVSAGYLYFLIAHIGTALIMVAFFLLYKNTGSFEFGSFRNATLPPATRNIVFLLAFFGFGAKAGIVPLHVWLPRAHPAAPSHVSALLSGVMIKTAVYGILRICVGLLGAPVWWWGFVVLCFGGLSALLGILYALDERDIKRLLAYSSVENIGIILMGAGVGMIGVAIASPILAVVGFLAALYHTINHALFKGLLFMGAGSVVFRTHTRNMNEMGGLARLMPWTGLLFLVGALSISAIPPLNGFVSEWVLFQALFAGSTSDPGVLRVFGPIFAMLLGLVGALAVMCFVKAYGATFAGAPRNEHVRNVPEAPLPMLLGMGVLALGAVLMGLGAPMAVPFIGNIAAGLAGVAAPTMARGMQMMPLAATQGALSTPFIFLVLLGLLVLPAATLLMLGGYRAGQKTAEDPWACGYDYKPEMGVSASNFAQPMLLAYRPLYAVREWLQRPMNQIAELSRGFNSDLPRGEPVLERVVTMPLDRGVRYVGKYIQSLHMGDVRVYCLYIFLALAVLLVVIFR